MMINTRWCKFTTLINSHYFPFILTLFHNYRRFVTALLKMITWWWVIRSYGTFFLSYLVKYNRIQHQMCVYVLQIVNIKTELSQHKNRSDFLCLQIKLFLSVQKIMIYFPLVSIENNEKLCQFSHIVNCLMAKKWIYLHCLSKPSFSIRFGFDLCSWLIQLFSFRTSIRFKSVFGPI